VVEIEGATWQPLPEAPSPVARRLTSCKTDPASCRQAAQGVDSDLVTLAIDLEQVVDPASVIDRALVIGLVWVTGRVLRIVPANFQPTGHWPEIVLTESRIAKGAAAIVRTAATRFAIK
jgi:hypothetical protein